MNNEPVAWVIGTCPDDYRNVTQVLREAEEELEHYKKQYPNDRIIPLYTHPVKEQLTDEEIGQIYADNLTFMVRTKEDANNLIDCARAILRKAQNG